MRPKREQGWLQGKRPGRKEDAPAQCGLTSVNKGKNQTKHMRIIANDCSCNFQTLKLKLSQLLSQGGERKGVEGKRQKERERMEPAGERKRDNNWFKQQGFRAQVFLICLSTRSWVLK